MLFNKMIYFMLQVNEHYAFTLRNVLFRNYHKIDASFNSNITNIENETEPISKYEQQVAESQTSPCKNTKTDLAILMILNATLIFFGFILVSYKVVIIFKRKLNKKRAKAKFNRRKRKNIVNNPHSEAFFEDI